MKRNFINQDDLSNKFWNIETEGNVQKVVFGKIGTAGRETIKAFDSAEACTKETLSLIAQKLRKGYVEVQQGDVIPEKKEISEQEKEEFYFWDAIGKSYGVKPNSTDYDCDEHIEGLTEYLAKFGKERLVLFEKVLQQKLHALYTAEIAELSIIIDCTFDENKNIYVFDNYLSDDGFIYFRCWLILKGKDFLESIQKDINHFTHFLPTFDLANCWAEGLLYVADQAYLQNHEDADEFEISEAVSDLYPEIIHYDSMERQMNREPLAGTELQARYPELVRAICARRSQ